MQALRPLRQPLLIDGRQRTIVDPERMCGNYPQRSGISGLGPYRMLLPRPPGLSRILARSGGITSHQDIHSTQCAQQGQPGLELEGQLEDGKSQHTKDAITYNWVRRWWAAAPISCLNPCKPSSVTILGCSLVFWHDSLQGWLAAAESGPPVSDRDPSANAAVKRGLVVPSIYPTVVVDGLLFVWMDISEEGRISCGSAPEPTVKSTNNGVTTDSEWLLNEVPNDFSFWVEQGMDPSHANYLHHGNGFKMEDAIPMQAGRASNSVSLENGFTWYHGGYDVRNEGMQAVRQFNPPGNIWFTYDTVAGFSTLFDIYQTPVLPGRCRLIGKVVSQPSKIIPQAVSHTSKALLPANPASQVRPLDTPAQRDAHSRPQNMAKLTELAATASQHDLSQEEGDKAPGPNAIAPLSANVAGGFGAFKMPHWCSMDQSLVDQDVVMMAKQEYMMRSNGLSSASYALFSRSDEGVSALREWFKLADYQGMWEKLGYSMDASASQAATPIPDAGFENRASKSLVQERAKLSSEKSMEELLSRKDRHVDHCFVCQQGLELVTKVFYASVAASAICVAVALVSLFSLAVSVSAGQVLSDAGVISGLTSSSTTSVLIGEGVAVLAVWCAVSAYALWCSVRVWRFRTNRFVTGLYYWKRRGGSVFLRDKAKYA